MVSQYHMKPSEIQILVVDDNRKDLELIDREIDRIRFYYTRQGISINSFTASSSDRSKWGTPDLVIVDLATKRGTRAHNAQRALEVVRGLRHSFQTTLSRTVLISHQLPRAVYYNLVHNYRITHTPGKTYSAQTLGGAVMSCIDAVINEQASGTGLPGKWAADELYKLTFERASLSPDTPYAIVFTDLFGVKALNSDEGMSEGDKAIKLYAKTVSAPYLIGTALRLDQIVTNPWGDEFLVFLQGQRGILTRHEYLDIVANQYSKINKRFDRAVGALYPKSQRRRNMVWGSRIKRGGRFEVASLVHARSVILEVDPTVIRTQAQFYSLLQDGQRILMDETEAKVIRANEIAGLPSRDEPAWRSRSFRQKLQKASAIMQEVRSSHLILDSVMARSLLGSRQRREV